MGFHLAKYKVDRDRYLKKREINNAARFRRYEREGITAEVWRKFQKKTRELMPGEETGPGRDNRVDYGNLRKNKNTIWKRFRTAAIEENPFCQYCVEDGKTVLAEVVDHILPRQWYPNLTYEPLNLQSLCHDCHNRKKSTPTGKITPWDSEGNRIDISTREGQLRYLRAYQERSKRIREEEDVRV